MNRPPDLMTTLREAARREGFTLFGVTPAVTSQGFSDLVRWIESGYAGGMQYFADRQQAYQHPDSVLENARSVIAMAFPYDGANHDTVSSGEGRIARYVWSGVDYHDTLHPKLKRLCKVLKEMHPEAHARGVVDTAPLMEREVAQLAGLGWTGKNTLLLNQVHGSYFFLACLLTDIELTYDSPHTSSHCGSCTACLDACPTGAFPRAGLLDATRCISYLTIEHRESIPLELRDSMGDWVFGCDVCQQVCPWNRKPARRAQRPEAPLDTIELTSLFEITEDEFRRRFRKTPLWRTRRRGVLRNAAIVLGNQRCRSSLPALQRGLGDNEPIVRGASAWALGKIGGDIARAALTDRIETELDKEVREEIDAALAQCHRH